MVTLTPGEERQYTYTVTAKETLTLESQSQQALKATLNFEAKVVSAFKSGLAETLTLNERRLEQHERSTTREMSQKYSLVADDPNDPNAVMTRSIECCPTYRRLLIRVEIRCPYCAVSTDLPILAFQELPKLATRTIDTLRNRETRVVVQGAELPARR
ncbi:hypothetical protein ACQP2F_14530 [Actinoplanes sp. CA-030573]|uniref:hypothetical protein n=1 Tax=Actinoplanes sp. CA-030573 TaxID=3239898 RepID=UPI003D8CFA07